MICEIICVAGFLCMSHLDIVHISSAYVHVICILSEHMRIMCILSAVVLDIFLPNRQCQCHPYIISSTLYIFYHGEYVICTPSFCDAFVKYYCELLFLSQMHWLCVAASRYIFSQHSKTHSELTEILINIPNLLNFP